MDIFFAIEPPAHVGVAPHCALPAKVALAPIAFSISAWVRSLQGSTCATADKEPARSTNANIVIRRFINLSLYPSLCGPLETSRHLFRELVDLGDRHDVIAGLGRDFALRHRE